ncbi:GAF and ANTAR domain-containing protein [Paeniglutamicibacter antarcticus]|uniref:GAF and ANTAR domain-containing protein n=1 Tax=Arthrobacter terrae TaxID=2935737 RepID=A0A931CQU8_9MICC|nr:GAF and ANTAR domain-containing protein [Arthrobacter terrae]
MAIRLGELARALQQDDGAEQMMTDTVLAAIDLIPGVNNGSISVVTARKHVQSRAASSDLARRIDAFQEETGQGPCLSAIYEERTIRIPDMTCETRWPEFIRKAVQTGVGSMLCFQLYVQEDNLGALNLYGDVGAFTDESEHVGLLVAAHAAVAYAGELKTDQLGEAISTRDLIGQAKGILMERYKITGHQAFTILARASSQSNVKLREVAEHLVTSGDVLHK